MGWLRFRILVLGFMEWLLEIEWDFFAFEINVHVLGVYMPWLGFWIWGIFRGEWFLIRIFV